MIRKTLNTLALFGIIALFGACQGGQALQDNDDFQKKNDSKAAQNSSENSLAAGYKFVNFKTFETVAGPTIADSKAITPEYNELACTASQSCLAAKIDKDLLTISFENGAQASCKMGYNINKFIMLQSGKVIVATTHDVRMAPINQELTCESFVTLTAVGGVIDIEVSNDVDFAPSGSTSTENAGSGGLSLGVSTVSSGSKSINVLPPDSENKDNSTTAKISEYIYLLSGTNWIGRVKPAMFATGTIEEIFNKSQPAIDSIEIKNGELFVNGLNEAFMSLVSDAEAQVETNVAAQ